MTRTAILLVLALACSAGLGLAALGSVQSNGCCRRACPSTPTVAESAPASAIACVAERLEAVEVPVPVTELEPAPVAEITNAAAPVAVAPQSVPSATSVQSVSLLQSAAAPALTPTQQQAIAARRIQRGELQQKHGAKPLVPIKSGSVQAAHLPKPDPMSQALASRRKQTGQASQLDGLQHKAEAAGVQAVRPVPVK